MRSHILPLLATMMLTGCYTLNSNAEPEENSLPEVVDRKLTSVEKRIIPAGEYHERIVILSYSFNTSDCITTIHAKRVSTTCD